MSHTDYLALYGALVSTGGLVLALVSLVVSIYVVRRDRAQPVIRASVMNLIQAGQEVADLGACVQLTVSNKGRRPMTITNAGWSVAGGTHRIVIATPRHDPRLLIPELPQPLPEAEACTFSWPIENFSKEPPVGFFVVDAHNQHHYMSWRRRRKLLKQIKAQTSGTR